MRKLILITAFAMMSTSSCYANLSLASNDPAPAEAEQQRAQGSTTTKPVEAAKPPKVANVHKRHLRAVVANPTYQVHSYSYGHCL